MSLTNVGQGFERFVTIDREHLPEFLQKYGSFNQLKRLILSAEKTPSEFTLKKYMIQGRKQLYPIYELPTKELCTVLVNLIRFAGSKKIREVGWSWLTFTDVTGFSQRDPNHCVGFQSMDNQVFYIRPDPD